MLHAQMGDLFYVTQRASVAAGVQVATGVGFAAGQAIAGFVGARQPSCASTTALSSHSPRCSGCGLVSGCCAGPHAGWRWPFVIVALPAMLAAFLMMLTTREPERGATEDALKVCAALDKCPSCC
jgi:MFS family permease